MKAQVSELLRYVINGVVATGAHYLVLVISLEFFNLHSAGLANLMASTVGIALSFLGNRYLVFRSYEEPILNQATRFTFLYALIAIVHGSVLFVWTDRLGLNYNIGFLIAVFIQVLIGYLGGKRYVFGNTNHLSAGEECGAEK